jgi:hypothetical protein
VEGYFALKFSVLKASTDSKNQFELPQCTGLVRNGGSRSLWGFPRVSLTESTHNDELTAHTT